MNNIYNMNMDLLSEDLDIWNETTTDECKKKKKDINNLGAFNIENRNDEGNEILYIKQILGEKNERSIIKEGEVIENFNSCTATCFLKEKRNDFITTIKTTACKNENSNKEKKNYSKQLNHPTHIESSKKKIQEMKIEKLHFHKKKYSQKYQKKQKYTINNLKCKIHMFFSSRDCCKCQFISAINKTYIRLKDKKYRKQKKEKIYNKTKFGFNKWDEQISYKEKDIVRYCIENKKINTCSKLHIKFPSNSDCDCDCDCNCGSGSGHKNLNNEKCINDKKKLIYGTVHFLENVEHVSSNTNIGISLNSKKSILKNKKQEIGMETNNILTTNQRKEKKHSPLSEIIINEPDIINDIQHGINIYLMRLNRHNEHNSIIGSHIMNHTNGRNNRNNSHIQNRNNEMNEEEEEEEEEEETNMVNWNESLFSELDAYTDAFFRTENESLTVDDIDDLQDIHKAAKAGNIELIKTLLEIGANVNSKTKQRQFTPLHLAAARGDIKCLEVLIENNADVNAVSTDYETPLWCASITNHLDICKYLLKKGALINLDVQTEYYDSALHAASMMGHFEIVKLLVEHGANTKCLDFNFLEPLHYASFEGHKSVVKYLIWHQIKEALNKKMEEIITHMKKYNIYSKKLETYYYLKYKSIFKKKITGKVLCCAITSGNTKIVSIILKTGADPNYFDVRLQLFPVHAASITGNIKIFKDLVRKGANIFMKTSCNNSPLNLTEDPEIKKFILEKSRKINLRNAWLIRMKIKSHLLSILPHDLFYRVCTFF